MKRGLSLKECDTLNTFISLPFGEKSWEEIESEIQAIRRVIAKMFKGKWIRVIPSYIFKDPPEESTPSIWFLGKTLERMSSADIVVFSPDWNTARGCRVEHFCAVEYGMEIVELTNEDFPRD